MRRRKDHCWRSENAGWSLKCIGDPRELARLGNVLVTMSGLPDLNLAALVEEIHAQVLRPSERRTLQRHGRGAERC